jgi:hypothetical protein
MFLYLPSRDLLHSKDAFVLEKQTPTYACGQAVLLGTSIAQVHESWEGDDEPDVGTV